MTLLLNYGDGPRAIYDRIKERILSGELPSGQELKIQSLAKDMGISIVPVREAIRMLASDHLIELRPRRSPVIAGIDQEEILEINQIRLSLEPLALAAAVAKHDSSTIDYCRDLISRDEASSDLWEKVELNRQFHEALLAPSGQKRILRIIADQFDGIARVAQFLVVDGGNYLGNPHKEHLEMLRAVEGGETDWAITLLQGHINAATERAKREIEKLNER